MGEAFIKRIDLSTQLYNEALKKTYEFNLMIVGLKKMGKSAIVKSLFRGRIEPRRSDNEEGLNEYSQLIEDQGVKLRIRCIETSNYSYHEPLEYVHYIKDKMYEYLQNERKIGREIPDGRVHCCLYLIPPYPGLKLEEDDIDCMKMLHDKVNLVPIIVQADTLNDAKTQQFKENVKSDLELHSINYYQFPYDVREDEEVYEEVKKLFERFPFAVIAADEKTVMPNGRTHWIRETKYAKIDIHDQKNCDFFALTHLITRFCLLNLIEDTHTKHYAKLRRETLENFEKRRKGVRLPDSLEEIRDKLLQVKTAWYRSESHNNF